jgi:hypothetical protein
VALTNTSTAIRGTHRVALVIAIGAAVLSTTALWGPVSRGLHEESVARWCSWSVAPEGRTVIDIDAAVTHCVEQALSDPAYLTALRASL